MLAGSKKEKRHYIGAGATAPGRPKEGAGRVARELPDGRFNDVNSCS